MAAPTTQATNVRVTALSPTTARVSCTSGDGASRIIWGIEGGTGMAAPVNNTTYAPNTGIGLGDAEPGEGLRAISNGGATAETVTGLAVGGEYTFAVTEYNGGAGAEEYKVDQATGNPLIYIHAYSTSKRRLRGIGT